MPEALVYILDDDPDWCHILERLLTPVEARVVSFNRASDLFAAFDPDQPGCVLIDMRMPGMDGLEVLARLSTHEPRPTVIVVSGCGDVPSAVGALQSGACDFITKQLAPQQVLERVRQALESDREHRRRHREDQEIRRRFDALSPREREVMIGLLAGRRNKVIAHDLGVSTRTVEIHRAAVMTKTGADSLSALVLMAVRLGGADPEIATAIRSPAAPA